MAHLIDKSAVVAEIERLENKLYYEPENFKDVGAKMALDSLKSFLNTLEVKEPASEDLEKELKYYCNDYYNCDYPKQIEEGNCSEVMPHIVSAAKHFAQWQKEQMMKDAVEATIVEVPVGRTGGDLDLLISIPESLGLKDGDEVKVIIIKE